MNDRFKIRMFDKNSNKMRDFENDCMLECVFECLKQQLALDSGNPVLESLAYNHIKEGRVFMQCTGLRDKNGTLIYEGDIVKNSKGYIFKVMFQQYECNWCLELINPEGFRYHAFFKDVAEILEVIGNIYENKELLDE